MTDFIARHWLEVIFGLITGLIGMAYRKVLKKMQDGRKEQDAVREGIQALLRDRIIQIYGQYFEKGFCPIFARDNVLDLYKGYHALGGNGTITHLVEEMQTMPTEVRARKEEPK